MPEDSQLKAILEAALLVAAKPLTLDQLQSIFTSLDESPTRSALRTLLAELNADCAHRGIELVETANGYRFQVKADLVPWIKRLWTTAPPRYSRALLETLAIIAYRQPITRTEIEAIRGISVSTEVIKKLQDYQWIRILAYRETPGRPALYGTTRLFLDHFGLKNLDDLPTLTQLVAMNPLSIENDLIDNTE